MPLSAPARLLLVLCLGLLVACGLGGSPQQQGARAAPTGTVPTTIYLPRLFADDSLGLQSVSRQVAGEGALARRTLESLIRGPDGDERARDFQYALDRRTQVLKLQLDGSNVAVELDRPGLERVHGRPYSELVFWSIVYTLTEVPGITRVSLVQDGQPLPFLGAPAFALPASAGRDDAPPWAHPRTD